MSSEQYNPTIRYEWLNQYIFETIEQVQDAAAEWLVPEESALGVDL